MTSFLVVPIYLDVLVLTKPTPMVEAFANFKRLPYFDGSRDERPDVPNLSEEILSVPFQNQNLYLMPGVHLHWALPNALSRATGSNGADPEFPAVPNRWLVTRRRGTKKEYQWLVESDYFYNPENTSVSDLGKIGSVSYPYIENQYHPQDPSKLYRNGFLGRVTDITGLVPGTEPAWNFPGAKAEDYLKKLTAMGYGEPAFAAFYPNCHSIFGLHDPNGGALDNLSNDLSGVTYDVLGWYADPGEDFLTIWNNAFQNPADANDLLNEQRKALERTQGWSTSTDISELPTRMVCYARIDFPSQIASTQFAKPTFTFPSDNPIVAVGNTSTEALSAYLATTLNLDDKSIAEEQLEALHLAEALENRRLDVAAKFQEGRHTKEFRPIFAGLIWTLRPEEELGTQGLAGEEDTEQEQITLEVELAELLNDLNVKQHAYDRAVFEIESLRTQIFADWYKYMLSAYPPPDSLDDYPDVDVVKQFLVNGDLVPLARMLQKTGMLSFGSDDPDGMPYLYADDPALPQIFQRLEALGAPKPAALDLSREDTLADLVWAAAVRLMDSNAMCRMQEVEVSDVLDWDHFIAELLLFPQLRLPQDLLTPPADPDGKEKQIAKILQELNAHIDDSLFYHAFDGDQSGLTEAAKKALEDLQSNTLVPRHTWTRFNRLLLEALFPDDIVHHPKYLLKTVPAPRYWEPNDPVVLLVGDFVKPTDRHGGNSQVACIVISGNELGLGTITQLDAVCNAIQFPQNGPGHQIWDAQPWNPIMLEWEVEFFPAKNGNNLIAATHSYSSDFIRSNHYQLSDTAPDLTVEAGAAVSTVKAANVYHGRSILVPHAKHQLLKRLKHLLKDKHPTIPGNTLEVYQKAYDTLSATHVLAQSLGGFNQALLMRKQTLQLPVEDPIGFADYQEFTEVVKLLIGDNNLTAPQPWNDFNPIRAGEMNIVRLRLIDSFGQVLDIPCDAPHLITSETLLPGIDSSHPINLPPRLAQASRLNFRWLSADGGVQENQELEMNDHPATTPVCGWVVANYLENSLAIYDQDGQALGSIAINQPDWQPAPGWVPFSIWDIPNPHLRKWVNYMCGKEPTYLNKFMSEIEKALYNVDPENFAQYEALALLMGRPMAIVRASLDLQLRGRPAIDHNWIAFRKDMIRADTEKDSLGVDHRVRATNGFTQVDFTIRIGESLQLNDGLVCCWVENEDTVYTEIHQPGSPALLEQSIDDRPNKLTMLIDPRGLVHATCGILPAKAIQIPPDQIADALRAIEVTFLTAPVLTELGKIELPVPDEPGYEWVWLNKENGVWADEVKIQLVRSQATFATKQVIHEGWLKLRQKSDKAQQST
jgi:hypothetical protein